MTTRLYYTHSYQTEFSATATSITTADDQPAVILDRSCFYPTSGGQPHDTGLLGNAKVMDVIATKGQRDVLHLLEHAPDFTVGDTVTGTIDWTRRYDFMQQHSGQHLLSQIFFDLFEHDTLSVHFGDTLSTLDLSAASLSDAELEQAEARATELIYGALPIKAYFVDEHGVEQLPLRRPPKVSGTIRIVEINEFDYSACGGTHVRTTAEVGPLKLLRQEKQRGHARITFVCGGRALADYDAKHRLVSEAATLFSTDAAQVPNLIARSIEQNKELNRQMATLTEKLLIYQAGELLDDAQPLGDYRIVKHCFEDLSVDELKKLAAILQERPGTFVLLATKAGGKLTVLFTRASNVELHMGNLLRDTLRQFGGGGGGRSELAQGGGANPDVADELLNFALQQIGAGK